MTNKPSTNAQKRPSKQQLLADLLLREDSLSVIARTITGTRWSGPAFFGTRAKRAA